MPDQVKPIFFLKIICQVEDQTKISITTQTYFEDHFYTTGWFLLLGGFPILIIKWYVGIVCIVLGIIVLTTAYKLVIDIGQKKIEDYLLFLGLKRNLIVSTFDQLDHISIKKSSYTQQLNYKSLSTNVHGIMYSAYLYTDGENYFLGESKNIKKLTSKVRKFANKLSIPLVELNPE